MASYESPLRNIEFLPSRSDSAGNNHQNRTDVKKLRSILCTRRVSILLFVLVVLLIIVISEFDSIKPSIIADEDWYRVVGNLGGTPSSNPEDGTPKGSPQQPRDEKEAEHPAKEPHQSQKVPKNGDKPTGKANDGFSFRNIFGSKGSDKSSTGTKADHNKGKFQKGNPKDLKLTHFIEAENKLGEDRVQKLLKWLKNHRDRRRIEGLPPSASQNNQDVQNDAGAAASNTLKSRRKNIPGGDDTAAMRSVPLSVSGPPPYISERWPHKIVAINAAELVNGTSMLGDDYLDRDIIKGGEPALVGYDFPSQLVLAESPFYPFEVEMVNQATSSQPPHVEGTNTTSQTKNEEIVRNDVPLSIINGIEISPADASDQQKVRSSSAADNILYPSQRVRPEDADKVAVRSSIWWELITHYRNAPLNTIIDVDKPCACLISAVTTGNCDYLFESLQQCVDRMGAHELDKAFPLQCTRTNVWKKIVEDSASARSNDVAAEAEGGINKGVEGDNKNIPPPLQSSGGQNVQSALSSVPAHKVPEFPLRYSQITTAEICEIGDPFPQWIPPEQRYPAPHGEPRTCNNHAMQYPMTFGTPAKNVQKRILPKLFDFFPLPLDPKERPVGYHDEDFAQAMSSLSYYCITHARGGWDCGRHYEFLGAGCVPYVIDIHAMPQTVMTQLPIQLLREVVTQPATKALGFVEGANGDEFFAFQNSNIQVDPKGWHRGRVRFHRQGDTAYTFDHNLHDYKKYWGLARRMLKYAQRFATSESMVSYVLQTMGIAESVKKVFVYMPGGWDNMGMTVITGLNGLGIETVATNIEDYTPFPCLENNRVNEQKQQQTNNTDAKTIRPQYKMDGISTRDLIGRRDEVRRGKQHGGSIPWGSRLYGNGKGLHHQRRKPEDLGWINAQHVHSNFHSISEKTITEALKNEMKKYDAVFFPFFRTLGQNYPYGVMLQIANAMPGRVAVISHDDSVGDPFERSDEAAKSIYFFSRELRRQRC